MSYRPGRRRIPLDFETQPLLTIDGLEPTNEASIDAVVRLRDRGALSPTTTGDGVKLDYKRAAIELPGRPASSRTPDESILPYTLPTKRARRSPPKARLKEPNREAQFPASRTEDMQSSDKTGDGQRTPANRSLEAALTMKKTARIMPTMPMSLVSPWARRPAPLGTHHHRSTTPPLPAAAVDSNNTATSSPVVPIPPPSQLTNTTTAATLSPTPEQQHPPTSSSKPLSRRRKPPAKLLSPSQRLQQAINLRRERLAPAAQKQRDIDLAQQPVSFTTTPKPPSASASASVSTTPGPGPGPSRQVAETHAVGREQRQWYGGCDEISDGDVLGGLRILCAVAADVEVDAEVARRTGVRLRRFLVDLQRWERLAGLDMRTGRRGFGG